MESIFGENVKITGTQINYLMICKKKLWFFMHGIVMEQTSDRVAEGKEYHDEALKSKRTEMLIDNAIKVDYIDKELVVHEIKTTKAMNEASKYQLLYYIYYLKSKGISCSKGIIHYPNSRKTETVTLSKDDELQLKNFMDEIINVANLDKPPEVKKEKKCNRCSYYELCYC